MEVQLADAQISQDPITQRIDSTNPEQLGLIVELIRLIGDDPSREGLIDTPARVLRSFKELYSGYNIDPASILGTTFDSHQYSQMVICRGIEFYSACEHHIVPFYGTVNIGYIPSERVVGLSKMARLVEVYSRRLQIQEKLTEQIANTMEAVLKPNGVMVHITAKHMCMCARGVGKQNSSMVTTAIRGNFFKPEVRQEFLESIRD